MNNTESGTSKKENTDSGRDTLFGLEYPEIAFTLFYFFATCVCLAEYHKGNEILADWVVAFTLALAAVSLMGSTRFRGVSIGPSGLEVSRG